MSDVDRSGVRAGLVPERYEIVSRLGTGGMGEVFRAHDQLLDRDVAIKIILSGVADSPERVARFQREARAAAALDHPNILTIHDVGEHNGRPFIVTELLEGSTLREEMQHLDLPRALDFAVQVADGLAAAHARGIVHRDLKPENIFITGDGRAKILDFGLAQVPSEPAAGVGGATAETEAVCTASGVVVGTAGYMAPEQVCGKPTDRRADIFVFGCVLYEMLTGRHPFRRDSVAETLSAILRDAPEPISSLEPRVLPELALIVECCLEKRPENRYESTRDLHFALKAVNRLDSGGSGSGVRPQRAPGWGLLSRPAALFAGTVVVVLGFVGIQNGRDDGGTEQIQLIQPKRITSFPGAKRDPVISPDGFDVAFSMEHGSGSDIWLMDVRGGSPLQVTDEGAVDINPTWFHDGSAIAFARFEDMTSSVYRVPRLGGGAVLLVANAGYPAISPDGRLIAFSRPDESGFYRIWVAPLEDVDRATKLTDERMGLWSHTNPAWSPDGSTISYQDARNLWTVPAAGGDAVPLTDDDPADESPNWSPDGRAIYFGSDRDGVRSIWRWSLRDGLMTRVTVGTGPDANPSLSRDGRRLVYSRRTEDYNFVLLDRDTGARTSIRQSVYMNSPTIAPDRSEVTFVSLRERTTDLWKVRLVDNVPEGDPQRLTHHPGPCANPRYSPDGRWIAYQRIADGELDIWVMPAEGGTPRQVIEHPARDIQPVWSSDGRRLAFSSDRSGSMEIWIAGLDGDRLIEAPRQVTDTAGVASDPDWSPDGTLVAFLLLLEESSDVYLVAADGSGAPRRLTDGAGALSLVWNHASGELWVKGLWGGRVLEVRAVDPVTGTAVLVSGVAPLSPTAVMGGIDVSDDGRLAAWMEEEDHGDLWMLESDGVTF